MAVPALLPAGDDIYGLCLLALAIALYTRPVPTPGVRSTAQVQGA